MPSAMLLVMDMINDLVHPEGPSGASYGKLMTERGTYAIVASLIARARGAKTPIGYVRVGFSPDYRECPPGSPAFGRAKQAGLFKLGSWGTEVYEAFAPQPGDSDIVKHRVSPFYGTALEPILRANAIERLVLCGVSTNGVVSAAAREGHDRDYQCEIVEDGCCGATQDEHAFAIAGLKRFGTIKSAANTIF